MYVAFIVYDNLRKQINISFNLISSEVYVISPFELFNMVMLLLTC